MRAFNCAAAASTTRAFSSWAAFSLRRRCRGGIRSHTGRPLPGADPRRGPPRRRLRQTHPLPSQDRFRHGPPGHARQRRGNPGHPQRHASRPPGRSDDPLRLRRGLHFLPNRDPVGVLPRHLPGARKPPASRAPHLHTSSTNAIGYGRTEGWHTLVRAGHALYGYVSPPAATPRRNCSTSSPPSPGKPSCSP